MGRSRSEVVFPPPSRSTDAVAPSAACRGESGFIPALNRHPYYEIYCEGNEHAVHLQTVAKVYRERMAERLRDLLVQSVIGFSRLSGWKGPSHSLFEDSKMLPLLTHYLSGENNKTGTIRFHPCHELLFPDAYPPMRANDGTFSEDTGQADHRSPKKLSAVLTTHF